MRLAGDRFFSGDKFHKKQTRVQECGYNVRDFFDDEGLVRTVAGPVIFLQVTTEICPILQERISTVMK